MILLRSLSAAVLVLLLAGCGDDPAPRPEGSVAVAACDDLRRRENELIDVANEALGALGAATDDAARRDALAAGYDRLLATVEAQEVGDDVEAELAVALAEGADEAAAELVDERARFLAAHPDVVTAADERGVAGQLQTALEKAFSHLEPPRSAYLAAGLDGATDADPDCRFVTQRADPAG